jgi:hypothetical protein
LQQCLDEGSKVPAVVAAEFQRRGVAARRQKLRIHADAPEEIAKPVFAAKIQLKSPMA